MFETEDDYPVLVAFLPVSEKRTGPFIGGDRNTSSSVKKCKPCRKGSRHNLQGQQMGLSSAATAIPAALSLALLLILSSAASAPANPHPQEFPDFKIREAQELQQQQQYGRGCSYTVKIRTSCSSPRYTRDYISIVFGDAYRNEVYVSRLDDPSSGTFERCSADTFKMRGPCGYGVCYLYLRRDGYDGWVPDSVSIYEINYGKSITFYYRQALPNGVWYGFNNCGIIVAGVAANATESAGDRLASES